jgi:bis(5'-nucleosyl)-tetraphosphatase (symmetrical)
MGRRIFVGDVQGCRVELEMLLEELRFDPSEDELHPVGDLVNRGPDSVGCLRLLRDVGAGGVLGNHDLHLLGAAGGARPELPGDTFQDVLQADDRDELLDWLAERPFVRAFPEAVLVHAGLSPAWKDPIGVLAVEDVRAPGPNALFAVRVRTCDAEGRTEREAGSDARPWHRFHDPERIGGRVLVFGHWAAQGLLVRPGLRGLDSGCVWGGELSAWIAEEDRIVQVPAERPYAQIE